MVHVDDVPRGLMCNCSCPNCYEKLMAQHGNVREGCYQPVSFLVHVSWYWSFIPLVLEYFIVETALEANIQFALNLHYKLCIINKKNSRYPVDGFDVFIKLHRLSYAGLFQSYLYDFLLLGRMYNLTTS